MSTFRTFIFRRLEDCPKGTARSCGSQEGAGVICVGRLLTEGDGGEGRGWTPAQALALVFVLGLFGGLVGLLWWKRDLLQAAVMQERTGQARARGGLLNFDHLKDSDA